MGKSILIVDDDELMRSFLGTVLKEEGHQTEEARNGQEGLAKLPAGDFDLVITDLRMPDFSGLELLRGGKKTRYSLDHRDRFWFYRERRGSNESGGL
jgi:CheY-like chemotaxis protein